MRWWVARSRSRCSDSCPPPRLCSAGLRRLSHLLRSCRVHCQQAAFPRRPVRHPAACCGRQPGSSAPHGPADPAHSGQSDLRRLPERARSACRRPAACARGALRRGTRRSWCLPSARRERRERCGPAPPPRPASAQPLERSAAAGGKQHSRLAAGGRRRAAGAAANPRALHASEGSSERHSSAKPPPPESTPSAPPLLFSRRRAGWVSSGRCRRSAGEGSARGQPSSPGCWAERSRRPGRTAHPRPPAAPPCSCRPRRAQAPA
mmetsp:Transcript_28002/g.62000  ORF Transcript_28002/g.62000 Transcript_28002/m.62000 type:complete len:263 (+) Transcript_28002:449-1237(+)